VAAALAGPASVPETGARAQCGAREAFLQRQRSTATLAFSDFHSAQAEIARQEEDTEERHEAGQRNRGRDRASQAAPVR